LGNTGLSATEGTWNSTGTTKDGWIKGIKDSLTCQKWFTCWKLLNTWSWLSDWPEVGKVAFNLVAVYILNNGNWLCDSVLALSHDFYNSTADIWAGQDLVILEKRVLSN